MPLRIREARGAMTGREFARRCGIAEQSLSRYERVGNYLPGAELLRAMCLAANVSADWLLCLTEERRGVSVQPSTPPPATPTPEQRAAIEDGARMGVELLPMMRDILRVLAAKDALRALCGKVTVGRDKVLRFPPESSVEVLRSLAPADGAGFNLRELAPLLRAILNPDGVSGVLAAAVLLRKGA